MRLKCAITMVALLTMLAFAAVAQAQINSNAATMAIHATYEGYVGLTVSPASVSIDLPDGPVATFTVNLDASTSYGNVTVYAYVQSATALWNGANEIPANHVYVGEVGGGTMTPLAATTPFSNYGVTLHQMSSGSGTANFDVLLGINTSDLTLAIGTYTGTLYIQAQAI